MMMDIEGSSMKLKCVLFLAGLHVTIGALSVFAQRDSNSNFPN